MLPFIKDFDNFVFLANKYRNIFRNNFLNTSKIELHESMIFFKSLDNDKSRLLYAISWNDIWIGHFGLRIMGSKIVLLDNAIRFSAKGGKLAFNHINNLLIDLVQKLLPDYKIIIILSRSNKAALKLHSDHEFIDCDEDVYTAFDIDISRYLIQSLNAY